MSDSRKKFDRWAFNAGKYTTPWEAWQVAYTSRQTEIDALTRRIDELNSYAIDVSDAELTRSYREGIEEGKRQNAERIAELEGDLERLNKLCWNTNSECRQHHQASNDKSAEIAELRAKLDALCEEKRQLGLDNEVLSLDWDIVAADLREMRKRAEIAEAKLEGWQLVPKEPTDAEVDRMLSARIPGGSLARDWFLPHDLPKGLTNVRGVVRAMLAAATKPATNEGE